MDRNADLTDWKAPAHFNEACRIVEALQDNNIAGEFSAQELVERASKFFQDLQWEASNRRNLRYR